MMAEEKASLSEMRRFGRFLRQCVDNITRIRQRPDGMVIYYTTEGFARDAGYPSEFRAEIKKWEAFDAGL